MRQDKSHDTNIIHSLACFIHPGNPNVFTDGKKQQWYGSRELVKHLEEVESITEHKWNTNNEQHNAYDSWKKKIAIKIRSWLNNSKHSLLYTMKFICDLILENHRYMHIYQNSFYWFFVVYRDRGMDWLSSAS